MAITGVITQIRTTDLDESIAFYVERIGLELDFRYEDFYAGIRAGDQFFHLKLVDEKDPSIEFVAVGEHIHLFFPTDDVEAMAQALAERDVEATPIEDTPWGTRQIYACDPQGHTLCFSQGIAST